jgi:hypothetical protein
MPLDPAVIAATSGILGSIVGALSSLGTTFMTQRLQARRERVSLDLTKREELYGEYIERVTPLFAESIEKTEFDPARIFDLYSLLGRIRLSSSDKVLREAEQVIVHLLKWYSNTVLEVRGLMERAARHEVSDPLEVFTQACRRERGELRRHL